MLNDPYTGDLINFLRGTAPARGADRPRRRPQRRLAEGRPAADAAQRHAFANDPLNLLAVDGPANQQKSDGDAATWLPPNKSYRCAYVARQISVKASYGLWVTQAEHDAMARSWATAPDALAADEPGRPRHAPAEPHRRPAPSRRRGPPSRSAAPAGPGSRSGAGAAVLRQLRRGPRRRRGAHPRRPAGLQQQAGPRRRRRRLRVTLRCLGGDGAPRAVSPASSCPGGTRRRRNPPRRRRCSPRSGPRQCPSRSSVEAPAPARSIAGLELVRCRSAGASTKPAAAVLEVLSGVTVVGP